MPFANDKQKLVKSKLSLLKDIYFIYPRQHLVFRLYFTQVANVLVQG